MSADPSLVRFRIAVEGALAHFESRKQEINDLNVFPVADGDTGNNMAATVRAVIDELDRLAAEDGRSLDEIGRDEIVRSVQRAAQRGGTGNSGVILSQLISGAAEELISRPGELIDPTLISAAMARAAKRAYDSVREPAEGTILTVARDMATAVTIAVAHLPEERRRLDPDVDPVTQAQVLADVLERAVVAGQESLVRGRELLPALREAGAVDAGGYGLTLLLAGVVGVLRGGEAPEVERQAPARITDHAGEPSRYRYCTNFVVTGTGLDPSEWAERLEELGDSVLVVGDSELLKVHVHTDEPERATALFDGVGTVSDLDVADMHEQVADRDKRIAAALGGAPAASEQNCGVLAVATGDGLRAMFESAGAHVLDGGPTLNLSMMELLAGINAVPADEVVVLPNSPDLIAAAESAAQRADKTVVVVPSRSPQAGLAALSVGFDGDARAEENAAALSETLEGVRVGGVGRAPRDDLAGRFAAGEAIGLVDLELVAWGEPRATLAAVLERLCDGAELLTCIAGEDAPLDADEVEALMPDGVELDAHHGGQPVWWWLLAAE